MIEDPRILQAYNDDNANELFWAWAKNNEEEIIEEYANELEFKNVPISFIQEMYHKHLLRENDE